MSDELRHDETRDHHRRGPRAATVSAAVALLIAVPLAVAASHRFGDVSDANIFHADIEWLADADVTRGCNPPDNTEFCPTDNVTREQMAAFMRRLATNQVVDAATAVTAETAETAEVAVTAQSAATAQTAESADALEGLGAAELATRAAFTSRSTFGSPVATLDVSIEAPAAGILVMNASVDIFVGGAETTDVQCDLIVDGTTVPGTTMGVSVSNVDEMRDGICATTGAVTVGPGEHTVIFDIRDFANAGLLNGGLNALWVPFDGTGASPQP